MMEQGTRMSIGEQVEKQRAKHTQGRLSLSQNAKWASETSCDRLNHGSRVLGESSWTQRMEVA